MMNILITGATGFLGSHLLDKLTCHHHIHALYRALAKKNNNDSSNITWHQGDMDNLKFIDDIENLDCVIHTAGIVHSFNTQDFFRINSDGTKNLILTLKKKFPKLHFILVSSLAARGPGEYKRPVSDYGRSKLKAEEYLKEVAPTTWVTTIIRPPMIIGPRDVAVLDIFKMVGSGWVLCPGQKNSPPQYSISCIFDLVNLIELIVKEKMTGIFYGHHPQSCTFDQLVCAIAKHFNNNFKMIMIPSLILRFSARVLWFANKIFKINARLTPDKTHELTATEWIAPLENIQGYTPQFDLEKTIEVTFNDYSKRGWLKP